MNDSDLDLREIELNQRHEEILARREALLSGEESYYDHDTNHGQTFIAGYTQAMKRNEVLWKDLDEFMSEYVRRKNREPDPKFRTLRNNYWAMVRNVYPVWAEEVREFKRQRNQRKAAAGDESDPEIPDLPPLSANENDDDDDDDNDNDNDYDDDDDHYYNPREQSPVSLSSSDVGGTRESRGKTVSIDPIPQYHTI